MTLARRLPPFHHLSPQLAQRVLLSWKSPESRLDCGLEIVSLAGKNTASFKLNEKSNEPISENTNHGGAGQGK